MHSIQDDNNQMQQMTCLKVSGLHIENEAGQVLVQQLDFVSCSSVEPMECFNEMSETMDTTA